MRGWGFEYIPDRWLGEESHLYLLSFTGLTRELEGKVRQEWTSVGWSPLPLRQERQRIRLLELLGDLRGNRMCSVGQAG